MAQPGAIGLISVRGLIGFGIRTGELLLNGHDRKQHAFVLLDDGTLLEAKPGGAQINGLDEYAGLTISWIDRPLSPAARAAVVAVARTKKGVQYNWWAYVWLGLTKIRIRPKVVLARVDNPNNAICSQLVDRIYQEARAQVSDPQDKTLLTLFNDGRDPGDVTPGDLWPLVTQ